MNSSEKPGRGKLSLFDRFFDFIYDCNLMLCKLLLVGMVLVISYTVFGRFVLNATPSWGEELGTFSMVWIALLSASLAVRDGRHIRMTIIEQFVPARVARGLHLGLHIFILLMGAVFVVNGIQLTMLSAPSILPATRISSGWLTLALPVSGVLILLMLISRIRRFLWQ